jgi:hypothetical protein
MRSTGFTLISLLLLALSTPPTDATCKSYDINNARWIPQDNTISVSLTGTALGSHQANARWFLIDTANQATINLPAEGISYTYNTATIPAKGLVELNDAYFIFATKLQFEDCPNEQAKIGPVVLKTIRDKTPIFAYTPSTNRDDSDFYLSPTIDGASGTGASYTLDTKLQLRKALVAPSFGGSASYSPAIFFIPGVDAKISSNPKEDSNSVLFQAPLEIVSIINPRSHPTLSSIIPSIVTQPAFVIESDKRFHDINAIFSDSEFIVLHTFGSDWLKFSPEPMIGFETGSNLKAQETDTYPAAILRADVGMHLGINVFKPKKSKPLFYIETDYIRRILLNPEPIYKTDSKGNYILVAVGTQPRDHVNVKLSYDLTAYVGFSLAYENGRLPPVYTQVSSKYTFGITFKGQLQYKPTKTPN